MCFCPVPAAPRPLALLCAAVAFTLCFAVTQLALAFAPTQDSIGLSAVGFAVIHNRGEWPVASWLGIPPHLIPALYFLPAALALWFAFLLPSFSRLEAAAAGVFVAASAVNLLGRLSAEGPVDYFWYFVGLSHGWLVFNLPDVLAPLAGLVLIYCTCRRAHFDFVRWRSSLR